MIKICNGRQASARSGGMIVLGLLCALLAGAGKAEAETRYSCRFEMNAQNREHISETMTVTVMDPAWTVLVEDDFTTAVLGRPAEAEVRAKKKGRLEFEWSMPLKKKGKGGKQKTNFRMTILTDYNEGSISTTWKNSWKSGNATALGTCKQAGG